MLLPLPLPLLLLLLLVACASAASPQLGRLQLPQPCPATSPRAHYSSKTAYQLVHGDDVTPEDQVQGGHK